MKSQGRKIRITIVKEIKRYKKAATTDATHQ